VESGECALQISVFWDEIMKRILVLQVLVVLVFAVLLQRVDAKQNPGDLLKYELVETYSRDRIQMIVDKGLDLFLTGGTMKSSDFRGGFADARQAVKLYKITYTSIIPEKNNKSVVAYGLIAIPENVEQGAPIVSYQHGTIFDHSWTPSNPNGSFETQLMVAQFATQGYVLIAPDYFGASAESRVPNSYFVAQSTAQACLDMYRAAMEVLRRERISPGKFFINGWSQGGYSTLAFLRYLELTNTPVAAAAVASGPADPLLFVSEHLHNPSPFQAGFTVAAFTNLMQAMDNYMGIKGYFERSINPKYLKVARDLYGFRTTYEAFATSVPSKVVDVFTKEFYEDSRTAYKPFWMALDNGAAYRWHMRTPLRTFHSYRDEAVPAASSRIAVAYQNEIGNKNAEAFDAGSNADHRAVYLYSLVNIKPWFDSLR
jgi:hypothetical protein